jgi:transketolase
MKTTNQSLRQAFGEALVKLAKKRQDFVVLDADVAGGTCTNIFRDQFPSRFIQCGIAEQNMMSVAAGISTTGIIPIVTLYGVFASMRAIEQARNSIAYPNFNVKIVASHLGLDTGPDGPTHQAIEDISIYRSIPNFKVISPVDHLEIYQATEAILDTDGPIYMRTGRSPVPSIYSKSYTFKLGKGSILQDGKDVTIIAVGVMVHRALNAAKNLKKQGIKCQVINMSTIKPIDKKLIIDSAKKTQAIVTAEDHNKYGGLGGAVSEVLVKNHPVPLEMVAINDTFAESGDPNDLIKKYSLDEQSIIKSVEKVLRRKNESKK